jgi:DNA invertase Pin-like site-specific DNA recombinase
MKPLAISYVRFSSSRQEQGDSFRRQVELTKAYCEQNNLLLASEEFHDLGVSGYRGQNKHEGRLGDLINEIKTGKIPRGSFLIIESLDRLSRDKVANQVATFLDILSKGVNIVTLFDNTVHSIDRINEAPLSLMMAFLTMVRANEESETKSKRLKAAWKSKRERAKNQGVLTSIVPMWLEVVDDKIREIPERSRLVREIFADCISGLGKRAIAKKLNSRHEPVWGSPNRNKSGLWNDSYITKILQNRAVLGELQPHLKDNKKRVQTGEAIVDYYPRIVSDDDFYLAKGRSADRRMKGGRTAPKASNLLQGIAKCADCRSLLRMSDKGSGDVYLKCARASLGSPLCDCAAVNYRYVEKFLINTIVSPQWSSILSPPQTSTTIADKIKSLEANVAELEKNNQTFTDAMAAGGVSKTLLEKIRANESQIDSLNAEIVISRSEDVKQRSSNSISTCGTISKLFHGDTTNPDLRRRVKQVIADRVDSIYCAKKSKHEIGIVACLKSGNFVAGSINTKDGAKDFEIVLAPWQLRPERERVGIFYSLTKNHDEEAIPEPKLFKMKGGFNVIAEILSPKAFENFEAWGLVPEKGTTATNKVKEETERFNELRDCFAAHFPIAVLDKFDGEPVTAIYGKDERFRPLEAPRQFLEADFFQRAL